MDDSTVVPPRLVGWISAEDTLSAEHTEEPSALNFAFVMNVSSLVGASSFTLAPGHELRRANDYERSTIDAALLEVGLDLRRGLNPWKLRFTPGHVEKLPEADWRYFVIGFQETSPNPLETIRTLNELSAVFRVAPLELKIAITFGITDGHSNSPCLWSMRHPSGLFHQLQGAELGWLEFVDVSASDVSEITAIHTQLRQHCNTLVDVKRYMRELEELQGLPTASPLLFLGYFALLESLLTHQPDPKDPLDSITRQVKNKVALLDNRFQRRLDYSPFAITPDKVWTKMYGYRSRLAHGDTPSFDGGLAALGDHEKALQLLKETVKAIIRQALREPQLVADLRNC